MQNEANQGGAPPPAQSDAERAAREQALTGPAQPETNESRQMQREERERQGQGRKKFFGDEGSRELARFIQENVVFARGTAQEDLDRLRIELGDEGHEAHVALRNYHRALANHDGHPNTPAGNLALQKQIEDARKALEANPVASKRLAALEKARRRNEPVDFTQED